VYVSLKPGFEPSEAIKKKVVAALETMIGKIARPRSVTIVPDMPKTRSGKLMRRVLSAISNRKDTGDVSTLANPEIVTKIQEMVGKSA
jgi:acetyl-CoA synthetase